MSLIDVMVHLVNLLLPGAATGAAAAALAKLVWRRELARVTWRRLCTWSAVPAMIATVGGLMWHGRDGRMSTYAAMTIAAAIGLWWAGFVKPR